MMMFVQLLVFTCACALTAADVVPPYIHYLEEILEAIVTLNENVLSMDGNIPLLNDPRRHYAEIMHVVHSEAQSDYSVPKKIYYKYYQKNINESAPFAIANPQSVVDGTHQVITDVFKKMDEVFQLVKESVRDEDNDEDIDEEIKNNFEKYRSSIDAFLAAGVVAELLNKNHKDYFAASSQNLSGHNFVITGAPKIEETVQALYDLYIIVYGLRTSI